MAFIEKPIWSEDGNTLTNVLVNDILVTYNRTDLWYDGTPLDDSKLDSDLVYVKYEGKYLVRNLEYGQVLQKDTMQEMRDLSSYELLLLKMGVYKHVQLNGYYEKGDTPAPINYTLSDTEEVDDGGSVIEVGDVKFNHDFKDFVDIRYFGAYNILDQHFIDKLNNFDSVFYNGDFNVEETLHIRSSNIRTNLTLYKSSGESAVVRFYGVETLIVDKLIVDGGGIGSRGVEFEMCDGLKVSNIEVKNIGHDDLTIPSGGIIIRHGCDNLSIMDSKVFNVRAKYQTAASSGIWIQSFDSGSYEVPKNVSIERCYIKDIYPISDADGVKILSVSENTNANLTVKDCVFEDCAKRAMKFQTTGCYSEGNTIIQKNTHSSYAFIDFQGNVGNSFGDRVEIFPEENQNETTNYMYYIGVRIAGSDITIRDFKMRYHLTYTEPSDYDGISRIFEIDNDSAIQGDTSNVNIEDCVVFGKVISFGGDVVGVNIGNLRYQMLGSSLFHEKSPNNTSLKDFNIQLINTNGAGQPTIPNWMSDGYYSYKTNTSANNNLNPDKRNTIDYDISVNKGQSGQEYRSYSIINNKMFGYTQGNNTPEGKSTTAFAHFRSSKRGDIAYMVSPNDEYVGYVCTSPASSSPPTGLWKKFKMSIEEGSDM